MKIVKELQERCAKGHERGIIQLPSTTIVVNSVRKGGSRCPETEQRRVEISVSNRESRVATVGSLSREQSCGRERMKSCRCELEVVVDSCKLLSTSDRRKQGMDLQNRGQSRPSSTWDNFV